MTTDKPDYVVPVLPSMDLPESREFYKQLGFGVFYEDENFLGVSRGLLELHFWPCDDRRICEASGCYCQVGDVDSFYADWSFLPEKPVLGEDEADHARISGPPENRPWGMREFYLWDPSGNLIRVGSVIETQEA